MDTKQILELPNAHRRAFVALLVAICIILVLTDIFIIPLFSPCLQSVFSSFSHAIKSAVVVSLFTLWILRSFFPRATNYQGMQQVEPNNITAEFEELLADALRWRYTGNFGRYLRGKVLPTLAARPNMQIAVSIIDPKDEQLCQTHADYRNSINSIDRGRQYDAQAVAIEAIVTIIHCAWYVANTSVSIELFLLSMFDPLRIDSNDDAMILTVEDRRRPALKLTKAHFMYQHFDLQMRYERKQGRELPLEGFAKRPTISSITESDVQSFLADIEMADLGKTLTIAKITKMCREARNPYDD